MAAETRDTVVVGAGVIGLSATLALRDLGADVLCLDRARPGQAQSGGPGRIFRHLHATDELVDLAVRARPRWRAWESRFGQRLVADAGAVHLPATPEEIGRLERHGVAAVLPRGDDLARRLGASRTWDDVAVVETDAGMIDAEATVAALVAELEGRVREADVLAVSSNPDGVVVSTAVGDVSCARALVCAGVETDRFAAEAGLDVRVDKALHARLLLTDPDAARPAGVAFVDDSSRYGVPVYGGALDSDRLVLGLDGVGADLAMPLARDYSAAPDVLEQARVLSAYAADVFPGLRVAGLRRCVTTALSGEIGDALGLWRAGAVWFLIGNNLFKFAPLLGELLAGRLTGESSAPEFFER